jgi:hypothetical protein
MHRSFCRGTYPSTESCLFLSLCTVVIALDVIPKDFDRETQNVGGAVMSSIQLIRRKEYWQEGTRARVLRRMTRLDDVSERVLYLLVVCALSEHLPFPLSFLSH